MAETELKTRMQRMADLVREIDTLADPKAHASVKELVQLLMDMHSAALERILELLFAEGEVGPRIIDRLGGEPLVSSLLVLYGLHPEALESRVLEALRRVTADLRGHGVQAEVAGIEAGSVRILASITGNGCGSTAGKARSVIENAICEAAPDVTSLVIEGLDGKEASGFVPLNRLTNNSLSPSVANAPLNSIQTAAGN